MSPILIDLTPAPREIHTHGDLALPPQLFLSEELVSTHRLGERTGLDVVTSSEDATRIACTRVGDLDGEAYRLRTDYAGFHIEAGTDDGEHRALETIAQLLTRGSVDDRLHVPHLEISDAPRFPWRGLHLDVSRHLFPVEFILRYLDLIALHRMNVFHWHLVDDQGWRLEIDAYPKLTEVGAWREEDGARYGGFYTKDDVRRVVDHATALGIRVVPEIELPGHSTAALAAYPEYSCRGVVPGPIPTGPGVFEDVYCAGNDATFTFLTTILDEVLELFPSETIHIGGDECPKTRWRECPRCQERRKSENLPDEDALQSYFIRRIEEHLHARGRRLVGWDEILEGGLPPRATVMSWRTHEGAVEAVAQGQDAILCPQEFCYFDHKQKDDRRAPQSCSCHPEGTSEESGCL